MENVFPLQEGVEIEEVYGSMRPNAQPPKNSKTYRMTLEEQSVDGSMYHVRVVPWFEKDGISGLERTSMEDVIGMVGETRYIEVRTQIINGYEDGIRPMTIRAALGIIGDEYSDLNVVLDVFRFVDRWGLINHKSLIGREKNELELEGNEECELKSEKSDIEEMRKEVDRRNPRIPIKANGHEVCECGGKAEFFSKSLIFRCSGCIDDGRYPLDVSQSDFVHMQLMASMWTKKEEFLLLEGINRFGDEWDAVSVHVGTKNRNQCIFHFLRMPILENTLSKVDFSTGSPFSTSENPIMCTIAFVCGMVHPTVASECARVAMRYINDHSQDEVIHHMLEAGRVKAMEQMGMERRKKERLVSVMCEALLSKIRTKIGSYKDLYASTQRIRDELIRLRRTLIEELCEIDE